MDNEAVDEEAPPLAAQLAMDVVESRVHERLFGAPIHECTIGRFEVLGPAGSGGMGVVFAARDPQLDRRVAIKLVVPGPHGSGRSQLRLLGEAQTMARLSHPNIVAVHEVGTYEGGVYLAMEYIEGDTLERWLTREPVPSLAAAIDVFVQAGRGLAAAHRAGVVHRDFKPANAMIDRAGRVRVLDFGLAIDDEQDRTEDTDEGVHESGVLGGTPLYMAPEQRVGGQASARSDQYAFCVSLWRALYGEHPFAPERTESGVLRRARQVAVPGWLRRVLLRGLEVSAARRWPSMEALLDALSGGGQRARRRRVLVGGTALALGAAGVLIHDGMDRRSRELACERAGEQLSAGWDDDARARVASALRATGVGYAEGTLERTLPRLDAQASALQQAGTAACAAATLERRWDDDVLARSQWCLELGQLELNALVEQLEHADTKLLQRAVLTTSRLSDAQSCLDRERLSRLPYPPLEQREEVGALRSELVRATAYEYAGRYSEALAVTDQAIARAEPIGWPPLHAALITERAVLLERRGDYDEARRAAEDGYLEAARAGAWNVAANASSLLVMIVGARMSQPATGLMWAEHAAIAEGHAGDPQRLLEALRLERVGHLHDVAGDYAQARVAVERALELVESAHGQEHPATESLLLELASLAVVTGEIARARGLFERVIAIQVESLGPEHPFVAEAMHNLGRCHFVAGELREARALFERGLEILERGSETNDIGVAAMSIALAMVDTATGELARAKLELERARPIIEAVHGREHPMYALVLSELGNAYYQSHDFERAARLYEDSLAIEERTLGPRHVNVAVSLTALGSVLSAQGEHRRALALLERAVTISEAAVGPTHTTTALMLGALAGVHDAMNDAPTALPLVERAVEIFEREPGAQQDEADAHALLAKLLLARDRPRALAEAEKAMRDYRTFEDADGVREVQRLLAHARTSGKRRTR